MWQPDGTGSQARIGVLTPHVDFAPESEIQMMAPPDVSVHAARAPLGVVDSTGAISPIIGPEAVQAFAEPPFIDDAAELLAAASLDAIIYAFTSSSYLLGFDADAALQQRLQQRTDGTPIIIPTVAAILALQAFGAKQIALIHPPWFSPQLDELGATYFQAQGFNIVHHAPAQLREGFGEIEAEILYNWTVQHVPSVAEAVFIGGNGMRAIGAIQALEEKLGCPVLTANQVALWQALQLAEVKTVVSNYGQVFEQKLPAS
ncbi:MAG: maleate cis-trans isomerase [Chloroflexota bacterium]